MAAVFIARIAEGATPSGSFITTYSDDFKPINERQLWVKPRANARPPPPINPLQHLYKTTNSTYGSSLRSQPPFSSLIPALLPSFGIPTSPFSTAVGNVGSAPNEAGMQEARVAREKRLTFVVDDEANKLREQELREEPQWKPDAKYEEGVIVLSPCVGLTCRDDVLKSLCREVSQKSFDLPASSYFTVIYSKDPEKGENSAHLWDSSPAVGLQSSSVLQPPPRRCSHCAEETDFSSACCYSEMQTDPVPIYQSSGQPLASTLPTNFCTGSLRKQPLTEYEANYSAEWARPKKTQQMYHRVCPCHRNHHHLLH